MARMLSKELLTEQGEIRPDALARLQAMIAYLEQMNRQLNVPVSSARPVTTPSRWILHFPWAREAEPRWPDLEGGEPSGHGALRKGWVFPTSWKTAPHRTPAWAWKSKRGNGAAAWWPICSWWMKSSSEVFQAGLKDAPGEASGSFSYPWQVDERTNTLIITF